MNKNKFCEICKEPLNSFIDLRCEKSDHLYIRDIVSKTSSIMIADHLVIKRDDGFCEVFVINPENHSWNAIYNEYCDLHISKIIDHAKNTQILK